MIYSVFKIFPAIPVVPFSTEVTLVKNSQFMEKAARPGGTLTIQLYLSATKGEFGVAFGIAVVLLIIVLGINFLTKALAKKFDVERR